MNLKVITWLILGALSLIGAFVVFAFVKYFLIAMGVLFLVIVFRWDGNRKKRKMNSKKKETLN